MNELGLRVIKLGGSLLEFGELRRAFQLWLADQPRSRNLIVVGGGTLADQVRRFDRLYGLGDEVSHRLALQTMSINARVVSRILHMPIVECLAEVRSSRAGVNSILDVVKLMACDDADPTFERLPHDWSVTSDSIAACIADWHKADELVLLKSSLPVNGVELKDAVREQIVDAFFPTAAARLLNVRAVNLRDPQMPQWQPSCAYRA